MSGTNLIYLCNFAKDGWVSVTIGALIDDAPLMSVRIGDWYFPKDPFVCPKISGLTRTSPICGDGIGTIKPTIFSGRGMDP